MKPFRRFMTVIGLVSIIALSVPFISSCKPEVQTVTATTTKTTVSTSVSTVTSTVTETVQLISVTDDAGITYTFEGAVDTIVSMAPSITEIVYFVGADDKLIGRTDYCSYPEEVSEVESIGGYYDPNKEKILLLNPDVVLADSIQCTTGDVEWLQSQGLTVIVIAPSDIEGVMRDITLVGELSGHHSFAADAVAGLQDRINAVCSALGGIDETEKPSVLHITWFDPLWTTGEHTFMDIIIDMAGGVNVFADVEGDVQVDLEQAVIRNPDIITVVTDHGSESSFYGVIAEDSPFKETNAYLNGHIYIVDSDIVCRAGPRIVDALEIYAGLLHPDLFS